MNTLAANLFMFYSLAPPTHTLYQITQPLGPAVCTIKLYYSYISCLILAKRRVLGRTRPHSLRHVNSCYSLLITGKKKQYGRGTATRLSPLIRHAVATSQVGSGGGGGCGDQGRTGRKTAAVYVSNSSKIKKKMFHNFFLQMWEKEEQQQQPVNPNSH